MGSVKGWLLDPTLKRWAIGWGVFLGLGLGISWLGYVFQTKPSLGDATIMLAAMLAITPIPWFAYMWVTAELVGYFRRRAAERRPGGP